MGATRSESMGEDQATRLMYLLGLPELELQQPDSNKDIWVVEIGANIDYDDWYDSIREIPTANGSRRMC